VLKQQLTVAQQVLHNYTFHNFACDDVPLVREIGRQLKGSEASPPLAIKVTMLFPLRRQFTNTDGGPDKLSAKFLNITGGCHHGHDHNMFYFSAFASHLLRYQA